MQPAIYEFLERASPVLILWSFGFTLLHSVRIVRRFRRGLGQVPDNASLTELAVLAALMADKDWARATADHDQAQAVGNDDRLRRAHAKLAASAARITAVASPDRDRHINHSVDQLHELSRVWSAAWTECQHVVAFDWREPV